MNIIVEAFNEIYSIKYSILKFVNISISGYNLPTWGCADCTASACTAQRYRDVIKPKTGGHGGGIAPLHAGSETGAAKTVKKRKEKKNAVQQKENAVQPHVGNVYHFQKVV